jgi:hypothetical protein
MIAMKRSPSICGMKALPLVTRRKLIIRVGYVTPGIVSRQRLMFRINGLGTQA